MAFYEHTFVGKQDLPDKEIDNLVSKYSDIIKKSGKILKIEKWGLLNLATKIKRNRKGIFIHFKFEGKNKIVRISRRNFQLRTILSDTLQLNTIN